MSLTTAAYRIAPRLHRRRLVRSYFFPWILLLCAILIALLSLHIGTNYKIIFLIWAILAASFILKDLASPYSLITRFSYNLAQRFHLDIREGIVLEKENIVYTHHNYPPLFAYRAYTRWGLYLLILMVLCIYAVYQSKNPSTVSATLRAVITFLIILYSLLIYSRFVSMPIALLPAYRVVVWTIVLVCIALMSWLSLRNLNLDDNIVVITATGVVMLIFGSFFVTLRLWADSLTLKDILDKLARDLLSWPQTHDELNGASARIGKELRHDRVFILVANKSNTRLQIKDQYGVQTSICGQEIPLDKSICGRAFREKKAMLWNDVTICPYFYGLTEDNTAAEMAIPITYRDEIFGILDVQSCQSNVFGPTDLHALQTVAQALGAAIAAHRSDTFFDEALALWQRLDEASNTPFASEEEAFELFADFARDMLHADQVIYFPLSLSDCPSIAPYTRGAFHDLMPIRPPKNDPTSSLVGLIKKWQPLFEENVTADSIVARSTTDDGPSFVEREAVRSTCFIPVGVKSERLGALYLNFREQRQFDQAFRFTSLTLAQALAKATAQIRYRDILYNSFGQPEISLHNILGRHGLKEGIIQRATIQWRTGSTCAPSLQMCSLYPILLDLDKFLTEISLAESSTPPNFWQENLESKVRSYTSSLPQQENGRRPQIDLKIDPRLERENSWVKLALYRVITEAVNNAILHGKADRIRIETHREQDVLRVSIENNGDPLSPEASQKASSNGIFYLLKEISERFSAEKAAIEMNEDGNGTIVTVIIPAIPLVTLHC